ncbi:MAG: M67 family metallopeptidase [Euryarchaeota archaeon]|nr:M67 family metallopeptidase [Euryarchaeota archaeon]
MTIVIPATLAAAIRHAGEDAFPEECCGLLVGVDGEPRMVKETLAMDNVFPGPRNNRYTIDPLKLAKADKDAEARGLQLIGFYHSHPDHPARPSSYDRDHAWPWYTFMITRVAGGVGSETTAWRLSSDRKVFNEEPIKVE